MNRTHLGWLMIALLVGGNAAARPVVPSPPRPLVFSTNNRVSLHPDREALPALLDLLRGAQHSIFIETFQFFDRGEGPRAIIDLLKEKSAAGVDVRVLVDRLGTQSTPGHVVDELRAAGIPTVVYGPYPFAGRTGDGVNFTHRKLYLVDYARGMTGGMNLGEDFLGSFHDMLWTVEGDAAYELHRAFVDEWARANGPRPITVLPRPAAVFGSEPVAVLVTSPREKDRAREILSTLLTGIRSAQHRVDIAYPFLWDDRLGNALVEAVQRGVQVHVMVTGHNKFANEDLNLGAARKLSAHGVQFRRYESVFAHIKYAAVDDNFLLVGSSNADVLTFENNQELDLLLTRPETVASFRARVSDPDWAAAPVLTLSEMDGPKFRRPVTRALQMVHGWL